MASTLARYLLLKNKICTPSMSIFCKKWLKVSLAKMVKKWCENLVMEIILFNTRFLIVPKIRHLRVIKRSGLRLELVNLAKF